jgi:cyclic pyranopterin phosphate synthase
VVSEVHEGATKKGDVRNSASLAAILAVKKTPLSLPHCHPIPIEGCNVEWQEVENGLKCVVTVSTTSKTGVEMEALCGVSTALLCAWDMLKPILKDSSGQYPDTKISDITVISKLKIPTEN